jgi:NADH:ubiquinone oxidoreductase subunit 4 (subunit M)
MVCSRSFVWNSIHLNLTIVVMILAIMICILLAGGLLSWLAAQRNTVLAKWIALLTVLVNFAITTNLWFQHSGAALTGPE